MRWDLQTVPDLQVVFIGSATACDIFCIAASLFGLRKTSEPLANCNVAKEATLEIVTPPNRVF
jgi:hypothetical protein